MTSAEMGDGDYGRLSIRQRRRRVREHPQTRDLLEDGCDLVHDVCQVHAAHHFRTYGLRLVRKSGSSWASNLYASTSSKS